MKRYAFATIISLSISLGYSQSIRSQLQMDINKLEEGANNGSAHDQYWLAMCYMGGSGVERNTETALKWFLLADQNGKDAKEYIADCYLIEEEYEEAIKWYLLAENKGRDINFKLGRCYYESKKYEEAEKRFTSALQDRWFAKASKLWLGMTYIALSKYEEALDWLLKASRDGLTSALNIGHCYYELNNYSLAIEWYQKAESEGNSIASHNLPIVQAKAGEQAYNNKDFESAFKFLEAASTNKRNPQGDAMRLLGACYRYDDKIKDNEKAQYWLDMAVKYNDPIAKELKETLLSGKEILNIINKNGL